MVSEDVIVCYGLTVGGHALQPFAVCGCQIYQQGVFLSPTPPFYPSLSPPPSPFSPSSPRHPFNSCAFFPLPAAVLPSFLPLSCSLSLPPSTSLSSPPQPQVSSSTVNRYVNVALVSYRTTGGKKGRRHDLIQKTNDMKV